MPNNLEKETVLQILQRGIPIQEIPKLIENDLDATRDAMHSNFNQIQLIY
jgi:hypothetical protein